MNNPQAPGAQAPGQQQPQQTPQMLKAEDIIRLQCLNPDQKQKYKPVMENFWNLYNSKPQGSNEWMAARLKLQEWSQKLITQERAFRMRSKMNNAAQANSATASNSQSQTDSTVSNSHQSPTAPATTPAQVSGSEQPSQTNVTPPTPAPVPAPAPAPVLKQEPTAQPPPPQGQRPPGQAGNQMNPADMELMKHVMNFPMHIPLDQPQPGTPEGDNKIKEMKNTYLMMMKKLQASSHRVKMFTAMAAQHQKNNQSLPPEVMASKQTAENDHQAAKKFVEDFRQKQAQYKQEHDRRKQSLSGGQPSQPTTQPQPPSQPQTQQQPPSQSQLQPPQQQPPQQQARPQPPSAQTMAQANNTQNVVKQEPQVKVEGGQQFNSNMGHPTQQTAQNQHVSGPGAQQPRPPPQMAHPNQTQFGQAAQQQQQQQQQQPSQQQPVRPQINPLVANAHAQQQHNSPHPQSATSISAANPVPSLSHQAAIGAAQRSYSQPDQRVGTPMQQHSQGSFLPPGSREREQMNNPKLPIPRTLQVSQPVPVGIGPARPTMSGPTNGAPGPMGQPVINKFPPFQLEGEGDRVLSKRKLDELVRQVTGGAEDALTPEVEETMLMLADEFVDNVIGSACKLAKLRESPQLEIRDIQLILERSYNIRIPGFASDEVRTVRKIVPAPGWTQKMNAVQAAKVMNGGKTDV